MRQLPAYLCCALGLILAACDGGIESDTSTQALSVVNLNLLHGFDCDPPVPGDGDQCRLGQRVELLGQYLVDERCPDIVTLQEIVNREFVQRSPTESAGPLDSAVDLVRQLVEGPLAEACGFRYELLYVPFLPPSVAETDEELILSRYPVVHRGIHPLHSALYDEAANLRIFARHVLHARVDHPAGPVDVYTTHLASGSDYGRNDCNSSAELVPGFSVEVPCPQGCDAGGTVRQCQARQMAQFAARTRVPGGIALLTGDFNAQPDSVEYSEISRDWLDTHLLGDGAPCEQAGDGGCTSGRDAEAGELLQAAIRQDRRIDYIFAYLPAACRVEQAGVLDRTANPFVAECGAAPLATCWMSDHSANIARLRCY